MKAMMKRMICPLVFTAYIWVILKLTIFRPNTLYNNRQVNLAIFTSLIDVYKTEEVGVFLRLFLGNIGWFVPFGFLLPILWKGKRFLFVLGMGLLFSFCIEVLQFAFRKGVAELDDLILNTLGTAVGYLFFVVKSHFRSR